MAKEEAMRTYVDELKKVRYSALVSYSAVSPDFTLNFQIIETMSMTSDVASFTNLIGTFYEFVPEGEEEDKVEEKAPNLATILKDAKPSASGREAQDENTSDSGVEAKSTESSEVANALGRYVEDSGAEEDEEDLEAERERLVSELASLQKDMMEIQQQRREIVRSQRLEAEDSDDDDLFEDPVGQDLSDSRVVSPSSPTQGALRNAVTLLQKDMEAIRERLSNLEKVQVQ